MMLAVLREHERAADCKDLNLGHVPIERALGVRWDNETNTLGIRINSMVNSNTRRGYLLALCSLYHPFGMVEPVTLVVKTVLQVSCKLNLG